MMLGRHYALVYALLLTVFCIGVLNHYPLRPTHESQFFLRGLTFSTLYKDKTLPQSLFPMLQQLQRNAGEDEAEPENFYEWFFPGPLATKQMPLEAEKRQPFETYRNVARYPVVVFLPQIIAGTLGDMLELPPAMIFHLARTFCALQALVLGCCILWLLPAFHLPFMIGLLSPVTIMIGLQQYADYMMTLSSYLFLALVLRYCSDAEPMAKKRFAALLICGGVLASSKLVYGALTLAVWLIPAERYGSALQRRAFRFAIPALCAAITAFSIVWAFWACYNMDIFSSQRESTNPKYLAATNLLLNSPGEVAAKIFHTYGSFEFWKNMWVYLSIWLVASGRLFSPFGSYSKEIYSLMMLASLLPALLAGGDPRSQLLSRAVGLRQRMLLLGICMLTALLIALGLFIDWTHLSSPVIQGIGGRYYIPLLPYMAVALHATASHKHFLLASRAQLALALTAIVIVYLSIIA